MASIKFTQKNGLEFVEYGLEGEVKAYTTTRKGLSKSGCNLYKDFDLEGGRESFRKVCAALGVEPRRVATNRLTQHTAVVRRVDAPEADIYNEPAIVRADGLVTDSREVVLYLYASDCALVFMHDPKHHAIGFCHAGWRGTVRGVIRNTVSRMTAEYGTEPRDLIVAIGPLVSRPFCGLTRREAAEFHYAGLSQFVRHQPGRYAELRAEREDLSPWPETAEIPDYYVDLLGADLEILRRAGVNLDNVVSTGLCTYAREDLFHSYFRGPIDAAGRHLTGVNGSFFWLT